MKRDAVINIRLPRATLAMIDRAADVLGKSRTEFLLDVARSTAINTLLDQRLFQLDADSYNAFVTSLDDPPVVNVKLKQLLASSPPWDRR